MAKQTSQSVLLSKLGDRGRKAFESNKTNEVEYSGFGELPAGIQNGIAQLVECKFDVVTKAGEFQGKPYFYAAGIVKNPVEHDGVRVEGLRTQITEMLCDTPTRSRQTVEDHVKWVVNELQKLGLNTADLTWDNLETAAAALKEMKPHFRFRTWKGQKATEGKYKDKEPMTNHSWNGVVEYTEEADHDGAVEDDSAPAARSSSNGTAAKPKAEAPVNRMKAKPAAPEPVTEFNEFEGEEDIATLAEKADAGDSDSAAKVLEMALAAGITQKAIDAASNWEEVAALMSAESSDEAGDDEETDVPQVDEPWMYKPPVNNPRTKKPFTKPIECEVTAVNAAKKTVNLKCLDNESLVFKGVSWSEISRPAE